MSASKLYAKITYNRDRGVEDDDEGSGCRGEDADAALPPAKLSAADAEETPSEEADKEEAAGICFRVHLGRVVPSRWLSCRVRVQRDVLAVDQSKAHENGIDRTWA